MLTSPAPGGDRGGRPERARRGRGGGVSPQRRSPPKQTAASRGAAVAGVGVGGQPHPGTAPRLVMRGRLHPLCRRRACGEARPRVWPRASGKGRRCRRGWRKGGGRWGRSDGDALLLRGRERRASGSSSSFVGRGGEEGGFLCPFRAV